MLRPMELDRDSPVPLYHQIAQTLRWKLGTGELRPGSGLPPLRQAAEAWGVNYHTVRRAYLALSEAGVVDPRRGRGTAVVERRDGPGEARRLFVAECNLHQARDLAEQVRDATGITAVPWHFEAWGEPPPGPVLGTTFHQGEMLGRWPGLRDRARFLPLRLDPELTAGIAGRIASLEARTATLLERDAATGREQLGALRRYLPEGLTVDVRAVPDGTVHPEPRGDTVLLVAPRLWDALPCALRCGEHTIELRHVFAAATLAQLSDGLEWEDARRSTASA